MWFRLAKELGMSVARCQLEISSAEFGEWIAYYSVEPFGDRVQDIRAGTIAAASINPHLKQGTPPLKLQDFFPWTVEPEAPTAEKSPEEIAVTVFGINLAEIKKSGKKQVILSRKPRGAN